MVAFGLPLLMSLAEPRPLRLHLLGLLPLAVGIALLLWCVRAFYAVGGGTLAPWDPPRRLVTSGPYQLSRNPMYLAVAAILLGWAVLYASSRLALYALLVMIACHLRVLLGEEPWAERTFGAEWESYRANVPRWLL
jgi:protein-S-isoprenylcysteine O-methyltransferase Ste14